MDKFKLISYSIKPIITIILIIIFLIFLLHTNNTIKDIRNKKILKKRYILKIMILENKINNNQISKKELYKQLSIIIREYYYERTGINIISYSLTEITKLKDKSLSQLINECYRNEFSKQINKNTKKFICRTKEYILNDFDRNYNTDNNYWC